jgi:uncharacterized membrane protein YfcA
VTGEGCATSADCQGSLAAAADVADAVDVGPADEGPCDAGPADAGRAGIGVPGLEPQAETMSRSAAATIHARGRVIEDPPQRIANGQLALMKITLTHMGPTRVGGPRSAEASDCADAHDTVQRWTPGRAGRLMSPLEAIAILAAGLAAGTINTVVGSGSLITFPTLLAFGYPAVVANVSNTVGLVPGSLSGAIGYRRELAGQRDRAIRLGIAAIAGGLTGGLLLLALPQSAFERIVPILILGAVVLIAIQPRLSRAMGERRAAGREHTLPLAITIFLTGVYGGYFGAGQGVIQMALLSTFLSDGLQRLNALKNVLTVLINGVAAILFIAVAPVAWPAAILLAVGAIVGGQVGAIVGRRLPAGALRLAIIVIGTFVGVRLLLG